MRGEALSGIAAEGLEGGSGIESRTLASLEWAWKDGRDELTARDVLVVDEAGMVESRQMERVLSAAQGAGAKVVLVGDPEQLQAIEAGAAFRALAERHGAAEIGAVRRQREVWQRDATRELATARTGVALERYETAGMVREHDTAAAARASLIGGWDQERRTAPAAAQIILAYTRADVAELNGLARDRLRQAGELGSDQVVQTERGDWAMASGDRLMFLRNERGLGAGPGERGGVAVKNGTLGTVLAVDAGGERLTVRLDGPGRPGGAGGAGLEVTFSVRDYAHLDHGYAATIHKAQGVTVGRAHVLASAHMDRHAAYVALTRHRDGVALHWSSEELGDRAGLGRSLGRERAKDTSLDYAGSERAYAERRGLDPLRPESAIVVPRPEAEPKATQEPEQALLAPVPGAGLAQDVAQGRARFRERFEAHRQQRPRTRRQRASWWAVEPIDDGLQSHFAAAGRRSGAWSGAGGAAAVRAGRARAARGGGGLAAARRGVRAGGAAEPGARAGRRAAGAGGERDRRDGRDRHAGSLAGGGRRSRRPNARSWRRDRGRANGAARA